LTNTFGRFLSSALIFGVSLAALNACSAPGGSFDSAPGAEEQELGELGEALVSEEDGLFDAYELFKTQVVRLGFDKVFAVGYGYHPGLATQKVVDSHGFTPRGQARIKFAVRDAQGVITTPGQIDATLEEIPSNKSFDLWFVKNVEGSGRTVKPETGDTMKKVGTFNTASPNGGKALSVVVNATTNKDLDIFDFDLLVITLAGQQPTASRVALGSRTLLEKRFFRDLLLKTKLDPIPVGASLSSSVESNDPRVRRGAFLFTNETFGGNGRVCSTCHRLENNLTIDPAFIATLPTSDPLFVAERVPALAGLENSAALRSKGLNLENLDGLDKPGVLRSVQHTFALSATIGMEQANAAFPLSSPDHRLGWSGDGSPGRGTLNEFGFGAIIQHFPKDLARRPGTDFRIPTQEELDSLEAFQLFSGRQKLVDGRVMKLRDAGAENGRTLFLSGGSGGKCTNCHLDMGILDNGTPPLAINFVLTTGVRSLTPELPVDDGFLSLRPADPVTGLVPPLLGDGSFNVQPVIEAADSGPFFHNNKLTTIEQAVHHYTTDAFRTAPHGFDIQLTATEEDQIANFLRVMNAGENVRQIRKRSLFVKNNRSTGNTDLLTVAIADTQDAIDDLQPKNLNPSAVQALQTVKLTLSTAKANADANRPAFIDSALAWLDIAKQDLFLTNPNNEF
jgi:cytochrome c peroxidase